MAKPAKICERCSREYFSTQHGKNWAAQRFCSHRCGSLWKKGLSPVERFWEWVVEAQNGCWEWTGSKNDKGYGVFVVDGVRIYAHRFAYELLITNIPDPLELDHLCRNRKCVNPAHLEPVTSAENMRRARKTHCKYGHEFNAANIGYNKGRRYCRECARLRREQLRARGYFKEYDARRHAERKGFEEAA